MKSKRKERMKYVGERGRGDSGLKRGREGRSDFLNKNEEGGSSLRRRKEGGRSSFRGMEEKRLILKEKEGRKETCP